MCGFLGRGSREDKAGPFDFLREMRRDIWNT